MQALTRSFRLLWDGLFLQHQAYEELREDDNPFVEGLFILVMVGVLLGVVAMVGTLLEIWSGPSLADIQEVVLRNLRQMSWYEQLLTQGGQEAVAAFEQSFNLSWEIVRSIVSPGTAVLGIVTKPLGLIIGWLVFGVIAHVLARLLGGTGTLNQTLGTTALAAAPQLINVIGALPFVVVAGVGTWTLLCQYMALRTTHDLSWPRAVWAAILPPVIIGLIVGVLFALGFIVFGATMASMFGGWQ